MVAPAVRHGIKRVAELALCRLRVAEAVRRFHTADSLILAYHNVVPDGESAMGDSSLHMSQRDFAAQLDLLRRTHDVVPLPALLEPLRRRSRPRAAITFDDAYRGALTAGVEELSRRRLPATFFVAPAFVDGNTFWWDVLHEPGGGLRDEVRVHALEKLQGRDAEVRRWASESGLRLNPSPAHQTCASEAELKAVQGDLFTVGSHTWSHPNLARLPSIELQHELERPRTWLAERFTEVVNWLAYPYGRYSREVAEAARAAGYDAALRVDGGWLRRHAATDPFMLPRMSMPAGMSTEGFELRISGVIG